MKVGAGGRAVDTHGRFRDAASRFASGVTVAAAAHDGLHHAITATAFASLSIDPPMVLLALDRAGQLLGLVRDSGRVGLSVLSESSRRTIGRRASTDGRRPRKVGRRGGDHDGASPVRRCIVGALAWFDCEVESISEHGDHAIIVGRVVAAASTDGEPLVYFGRHYRKLGRQLGRSGVSR